MPSPVSLIDSHCHPPPPDRGHAKTAEWMERSEKAGVHEWIAIGTESGDWSRHAALAGSRPGKIHWTAGLHPSHVEEDFEEELARLETLLGGSTEIPPPCAVGEIGLDYTRIPKEDRERVIERQKSAFAFQLELAVQRNLPVVIHSRGTVPDCLKILESSNLSPERAVFHCFAEGPDTLDSVRRTGAQCSFTGIPTFRSADNVREALIRNGLESLILETDSPYLSPEPFRGKPNEPARVRVIAEFCSELFHATLEEVARITRRNTQSFFGL